MVYLGLGSNSADKIKMLTRARVLLSAYVGYVEAKSKLYKTDPWGEYDQPTFVNQVIAIQSKKSLHDLHDACLKIEKILGKKKTTKYGPRNIDIDILLFHDKEHTSDDLQIPHPRMHLRNFVLIPLADIAPEAIVPVKNQTVSALLEQSKDQGKVTPLAE